MEILYPFVKAANKQLDNPYDYMFTRKPKMKTKSDKLLCLLGDTVCHRIEN